MSNIPLQAAYLKFVNVYGGCEYGVASQVFKKLSQIKNGTLVNKDRNALKLLTPEEKKEREKENIRNKRLIFSLDQFSLMFIEHPVPLFFGVGDRKTEISSKEIFDVQESIQHLLDNEFETFYGQPVLLNEVDFRQSCHRFFYVSDDTGVSQDHKALIENLINHPRAFCCFDLFNKHAQGLFNLLSKYSDDESYKDDGEVSFFLQQTYKLSSTDANRYFLPILKGLKF